MIRPLGLLIVAIMLSGCQRSGPAFLSNPFGRTRVEPPRTGYTKPPGTTDRYDSDGSTTLGQLNGPGSKNAPFPLDSDSRWEDSHEEFVSATMPVRTSVRPGDCVLIPVSAHEEAARTDEIASQIRPTSALTPGSNRDSVRDSPVQGASQWPISTPDRGDKCLHAPRWVVDTVDTTERPPNHAPSIDREPSSDTGIRLVSAIEPISRHRADSSESPDPHVRYSHHPQYEWIRGRLEYSLIDLKWKLRYIPVDDEVDDFGGSVVLLEDSSLSHFKRGDFVEVHGRLGSIDQHDGLYAPDYQVQRIKKQGG